MSDFPAMVRALRREEAPARVFNVELFVDEPVRAGLAERMLKAHAAVDPSDALAVTQRDAALFHLLGYDLVRVHLPDAEFPMELPGGREASRRSGQGYIIHEQAGPIQTPEDIEAYPWPDISRLDTRPLEWADRHLPEGMKAYDLTSQFFECASWLMGYESLFLNIHEDPGFVEAVLARIARVYHGYTRLLCQFDCIGVIWGTDDMGFKTQTIAAPGWLRRHILPLHKEAARIAHEHGKLYFLHSCGKIDALMDDLIDDVGIDAKHSFEDAIVPVEDAWDRWAGRIGILGGLDVDFLSRATPEEVRARVRRVLDHCQPCGGYALGSGNSITSYIPLANYLAMLDEGQRFGRC